MEIISIKGIVLREVFFGEKSRLSEIFTDNGLITARTSTSYKAGALQLFAYSNLIISKSREFYHVKESQLIRNFYNLRNDIKKIALAYYLAELILYFYREAESENSNKTLRLLLNSLHFIEKGAMPLSIIKSYFELKLLTIQGYMPNNSDEIIKHICTAEIDVLWKKTPENIKELTDFSEKYLKKITERNFKTLEFYNNIGVENAGY